VPSLPWPCSCGRGCGGYCQIGSRAADGDPDLEAYCIADCRALYDGLVALDEFAESAGIRLRGTLGHTAWTNAQSELGVPDSEITWEFWRHAKRGDRGGRIAVIRPHAKGPGSHHDICNAYPAQLAHKELPVGSCVQLGGKRARMALGNTRPGIYSMTVRVPDDLFLPPLPWNYGGQMNFPTGVFSGTWTLPELVCAFERGVTVEKVHAALVFEATAPIFAPLVERWYAIRREIGRKTPFGQWIGRLPKALTGKFAEKPERSRTVMHPESIKVCLRTKQCRNGCTGRCGAYEQIDLAGDIWAIPYQRLGESAYPQWSAYLRAQTRVQWLEQAELYGSDLCHGNTDSLWTIGRRKPQPLGDGLGEWEYVNAWTDLEVRSPTCYAYRDPKTNKLEIRGVPGLTEDDWKRGHGTLDRGIVTFGRAASTSTKGLFRKRHRRWRLPSKDRELYGDRRLSTGGITYPMDAQEIREMVAARKLLRG
jgi:DNA polymerase type B, organellar and viral